MSHLPSSQSLRNAQDRAAQIKLMIFDVDGVLTDGQLHFGSEGEFIKTFNVLDGQGIRLLQQYQITLAIISARQSSMVSHRASDLGIKHIYQGAHDKQAALHTLLAKTGFCLTQTGFMGDDLVDLPVLSRVRLAVSVPNAHPDVLSRVHYVTQAPGGQGAVRELCDLILRAQGHYEHLLASYLK